MVAHPQSQLSLLLLGNNLRKEALSRARVYAEMEEKLRHDRFFVEMEKRKLDRVEVTAK